MVVYDVVTKTLDKELFPQHFIAEENSGIIFIVFLGQEKRLPRKEINRHTYTYAQKHKVSKLVECAI